MNKRPLTALTAVIATLGLAFAGNALAAPKIDRIEVSNQPAMVGKPVTITVSATEVDDTPCAVQLDFGDGNKDKPQKTGGKFDKFPRTWTHTYAKPGKYTLVADGARAGNIFGCVSSAKFDLNVEAAPAAEKKAEAKDAKKDAKVSPCPTDWALKGKVAKSGSFTCTPAKGVKNAAKPEKELECPKGTVYFTKGKSLGCVKE